MSLLSSQRCYWGLSSAERRAARRAITRTELPPDEQLDEAALGWGMWAVLVAGASLAGLLGAGAYFAVVGNARWATTCFVIAVPVVVNLVLFLRRYVLFRRLARHRSKKEKREKLGA